MVFLRVLFIVAVLLTMFLFRPEPGTARSEGDAVPHRSVIERGRYLTVIGGCNDCHTPMFGEQAGQVAEEQWLIGSSMGFRGPWGTTYPTNLRLMVQRMSESDWIDFVTTYEALPPMPWWALHGMERSDLQAIYQFIHALGAAGEEVPAPLPPDVEPSTPFIPFMPVFPAGGGQ